MHLLGCNNLCAKNITDNRIAVYVSHLCVSHVYFNNNNNTLIIFVYFFNLQEMCSYMIIIHGEDNKNIWLCVYYIISFQVVITE